MNYSAVDLHYLLQLARLSLDHFFKTGRLYTIRKDSVPKEFLKKGASFVTLTMNGDLRGCIGTLSPSRSLCEDIINNTYCAAFSDPRFSPLNKDEFKSIKIEISILNVPHQFTYKDYNELVKYLCMHKEGVVLTYGPYTATFLPQVWEQLPIAEDFLSHLCQKAGLHSYDWKKLPLSISTYTVSCIKED